MFMRCEVPTLWCFRSSCFLRTCCMTLKISVFQSVFDITGCFWKCAYSLHLRKFINQGQTIELKLKSGDWLFFFLFKILWFLRSLIQEKTLIDFGRVRWHLKEWHLTAVSVIFRWGQRTQKPSCCWKVRDNGIEQSIWQKRSHHCNKA